MVAKNSFTEALFHGTKKSSSNTLSLLFYFLLCFTESRRSCQKDDSALRLQAWKGSTISFLFSPSARFVKYIAQSDIS